MAVFHAKKKKKAPKRAERLLIEWTVGLLVALCAALLLTEVVFVYAHIPSASMENTIYTGDRILGLRQAYAFSSPERGDIILFEYPDDTSQTYIKRIIGLPGDVVDINLGRIYLNGETVPMSEEYLKDLPKGDFGPFTVPEDSYFVLGDNRLDSWDSRYWNNTFVQEDQIIGKAWLRVYPGFKFL